MLFLEVTDYDIGNEYLKIIRKI